MRKTIWLLINDIDMKKFAWRKCWKIFLEATFSHLRKLFSKFLHTSPNPELRCVICTGVTLFALLSANQN